MNVHIFQDVEVVSVHPAEVEIISVHSDCQNQIAESAWREFPQTSQQQRVYFKAFIRQSYLRAGCMEAVPKVFDNSNLKRRTRTAVTLRVSDWRTWEAQYVSRVKGRRRLSGLGKFISDTHLKEGDLCVFEV
ncbi:hypothetical protein MKX01_018526 [Papaver californicum]|nr:hypothetical protein MKX01_018526 [Papaver californicum]